MDHKQFSILASAVASLFAVSGCSSDAAPVPSKGTATQAQTVKCEGINTCKGTSECKSSDGKSACQGQNECKGQGWVTQPSAAECVANGGKVYTGQAAGAASDAGNDSSKNPDAVVQAKSLKCEGINTCKGTSDCASKDSSCKGQNECKGHGWVAVPAETDCTSKGGKIIS
jgi:hypothetical protein